jgi:hypothetical protein
MICSGTVLSANAVLVIVLMHIAGGLKASDLLPALSAVPMAVMTAIATVSTSYHDESTCSLHATLTVDNSLQAE